MTPKEITEIQAIVADLRAASAVASTSSMLNGTTPEHTLAGRAANTIAHLLSELDKRDAEIAKEEHKFEQVIDERDKAEEAISQAYYLVIGQSPQWSNKFGHDQALDEIDNACGLLRGEIKRLKSDLRDAREACAPLLKRLTDNEMSFDNTGPRPDNFSVSVSLGELRALRNSTEG